VTSGKSLALVRASSAHQEGRFAIVTKRGAEDAVDATAQATNARSPRTAKSCGLDVSTLTSTLEKPTLLLGTVTTSPIAGESTKETVKTIARGMPGGPV
jgi:hypothetical protein